MDINNVFGQTDSPVEEERHKQPGISPFDFINAINSTKQDLIEDDWSERQYVPYLINRGLSFSADTVIFANEMNARPHLDKKLQNAFLLNSIRPLKRYNKWIKAVKNDALEDVKTYYGYNSSKALETISVLTEDQLNSIRQKNNKGGM